MEIAGYRINETLKKDAFKKVLRMKRSNAALLRYLNLYPPFSFYERANFNFIYTYQQIRTSYDIDFVFPGSNRPPTNWYAWFANNQEL